MLFLEVCSLSVQPGLNLLYMGRIGVDYSSDRDINSLEPIVIRARCQSSSGYTDEYFQSLGETLKYVSKNI